ncbi:MAG: hypothetical protein CL932_02935 [Deltaproteobacteria bacterium]|nr:hypothetical protein [Deltaproteobacteria bacterium]
MRSLYGERTLSIAPGLNPVTPTKQFPLRNDSIHAPVSRNVRWKNPPKGYESNPCTHGYSDTNGLLKNASKIERSDTFVNLWRVELL